MSESNQQHGNSERTFISRYRYRVTCAYSTPISAHVKITLNYTLCSTYTHEQFTEW